MKLIRLLSRLLIGALFIFSGFVKAVDPHGFQYKLIDYFEAFGMDWASSIALPLAIILISLEFLVGLALFAGIRTRNASWGALLFMVFFTPLTFYLAIANPVKDCGCFGDAWVITNWETFFKNLFLLVPTLFTFTQRKKYEQKLPKIAEWIGVILFALFATGISIYSLKHLPLIDFRPYKIGANIPDGMKIPDGAPQDEYEIAYVYEKDGVQKEFVYPEYPDSTWTWVSTDSKLIKKGYEAPIHDFMIETENGEDITSDVLYDPGFSFLLVGYNLKHSSLKYQDKINDLSDYCMSKDYRFACLTSTSAGINSFISKSGATYPFYNMDEITLKTIVRSNPGLVILYDGTVIGKFSDCDIPSIDEFKGNNVLTVCLNKQREKTNYQTIMLLIFVILIFILLIKK